MRLSTNSAEEARKYILEELKLNIKGSEFKYYRRAADKFKRQKKTLQGLGKLKGNLTFAEREMIESGFWTGDEAVWDSETYVLKEVVQPIDQFIRFLRKYRK